MIAIIFEILKFLAFHSNILKCPVKLLRNQMHRAFLILYVGVGSIIGYYQVLVCPPNLGHDAHFVAAYCLHGYLLPLEKKSIHESESVDCTSPPTHDEFW